MAQINPTPNVNSQYGAPMGRPGFGHGAVPTTPFELRRIPINSGGYDRGGAYWGLGAPLYWYCSYATEQVPCGVCQNCGSSRIMADPVCRYGSDDHTGHKFPMRDEEIEISDYIRADNREHAKEIIRRKYPQATFKR